MDVVNDWHMHAPRHLDHVLLLHLICKEAGVCDLIYAVLGLSIHVQIGVNTPD